MSVFEATLTYATIGFAVVFYQLLRARNGKSLASFAPVTVEGKGSNDVGCGDGRVYKQYVVFGGASAFSFGLLYTVLSRITTGAWSEFFRAYALFQILLSIGQFVWFMVQVQNKRPTWIVGLKSHLNQCGFTTGWSPFWPIFFLSNVRFLKPVVATLRDALTVINWVESLPAMIIITLLTKLLVGQWTVSSIGPVDRFLPH